MKYKKSQTEKNIFMKKFYIFSVFTKYFFSKKTIYGLDFFESNYILYEI